MPSKSFHQLVILRNPASTRANQMELRIEALRRSFADVPTCVLDTVPGGDNANLAMLQDHLSLFGPHTLLCVAAGDGTVHFVINFLLNQNDQSGAPETVVLPLWGGNANDLANMLNGLYMPHVFEDLHAHGAVISIRPLECTLQSAEGLSRTIIASNYISFGATASVAKQLNDTSHRRRTVGSFFLVRIVRESYAAIKTLIQSSRFEVEEHSHHFKVYEKIFANGPRFAKLNVLPISLAAPNFYAHTFEHKQLGSIVSRLFESLRARNAEDFLVEKAEFMVHSPVTAQFDGETHELPAGTRVTIVRSSQSFNAYTRFKDRLL